MTTLARQPSALPFPKTDTLRAYLAQIIESEPSRPSTFNARIDDEIETIALTCLNRDPQRRYQSVDQLAADVRRYLSGEPIEAKRDAALYVLRKHLRRYRLPLAVAALFMVVILTGLLTSLTYWRRAERSATVADQQATRARREANTATYALDFVSDMFLGLDPDVAKGKDPAILRVMLDDAAARAEGELHESPEAQARVYAILGRAYHCIFEPSIAASFLDKSATLRRELKIGGDAESLRLQLVSAASRAEQGQFGLAAAALEDLYWTAVACHGPEAEVTLIAQFMRGSIRLLQGRVGEGISILEDLCKTAERALPAGHHVREGADFALAAAYQQAGRPDEAQQRWSQVYQSRLERYGEDATETLKARGGLTELYVSQQRFAEAEPLLRKNCDTAARLLGADSPETLRYRQTLGLCLRDSVQVEAGADVLEDVLDARRRVLGEEHPETAASLHEVGMSRLVQGRPAEAAELLRAALGTYRQQLTETHGSVVTATTGLAQALIALARFDEAEGILIAMRQAVEQDAAVPAPLRCAVAQAFVRLYEAWSAHRGDLGQSLQNARDAAAQKGCD